jgi:hypothetical protein
VNDWSGGRFGGPSPVGGSGPVDPAADRWQPQGFSPDAWRPQQPVTGAGQPHGQAPSDSRDAAQPPAAPRWQPHPAPPGPPGPPTFGPLPPGWPPHKSRKALRVTRAAGGAVIAVVAIVLAITLAGGSRHGGGGSAGDVVKGYLHALARGDGEAALSYGADKPATKEFLTDGVLKKQVAQWPITKVRILNDNSTGAGVAVGLAQVHVAANFGDKTSDTTLDLKKDQGRWKLPSAAIKIKPNPIAGAVNDAAAKTVTFFGKPPGDSTVYVFPGWTEVGTTNPYMTATSKPLLLDQLTLVSETTLRPDFALSDKGRDAVRDQLNGALANCRKSNLLAPPGCPVHVDRHGLAEGTASWGPADISGVKLDTFDHFRLELTFYGQINMSVTVKTTSGATKQGDNSFLSGTADMAKTPPELRYITGLR